MVILKPSKRLQDILLEKGPSLECFASIKQDIDESRVHEEAKKMLGITEIFYSSTMPRESGFYNLMLELMKNSRAHAAPKIRQQIEFAIFLSRSAMCAAISDGGEFYRRDDIKQILENKLELSKEEYANKKTGISGSYIGIDIIFGMSDVIEVDTSTGSIYCLKRIK